MATPERQCTLPCGEFILHKVIATAMYWNCELKEPLRAKFVRKVSSYVVAKVASG